LRKIGILGCGAIGSLIAKAVETGIIEHAELILYDYSAEKASTLHKSLRVKSRVVESLDEMINLQPSIIVEAASQQAVKNYLRKILRAKIEVIVMSVGALLDMNLDSPLIHFPSGAIGGIDAIASARFAGIDEISLTTRKNPRTLNADKMKETIVFEGDAPKAVKLFPREMNVAATLALTVRPKRVKVKVISDPKIERNVHEIKVKWKYGDMLLNFENDPHPENPGTSALAAWSAINLLKNLLDDRNLT